MIKSIQYQIDKNPSTPTRDSGQDDMFRMGEEIFSCHTESPIHREEIPINSFIGSSFLDCINRVDACANTVSALQRFVVYQNKWF